MQGIKGRNYTIIYINYLPQQNVSINQILPDVVGFIGSSEVIIGTSVLVRRILEFSVNKYNEYIQVYKTLFNKLKQYTY